MSDGVEDFLAAGAETHPEIQTETTETQQETGEQTQAAAETTETAPQPQQQDAEKGLQAALLAERRQRQELERKLAEKEQEEKPYLGEEYEQRFTETEQRFQHQLIQQKLDLSESLAREKYQDFDEKVEVFKGLLEENPNLYAQMVQQVNPAEFVYKTATAQQKLKDIGDPVEYEKQLEARIRAKIEAEIAQKAEAEAKKRQELPGSLATATGATGIQARTWNGPTSLDDILK